MSPEENSPEASNTAPKAARAEGGDEELPQKARQTLKASRWEVYFPTKLDAERDAVHVASFMPILYFWPAMVTFFVCGVIQSFGDTPSGTLGWIALLVFAFNVLVIVQDFDQKKFMILVLFVLVCGLGVWIINMKGLTFLKSFTQWLIDLTPTLSTSAYFILSAILCIFLVWSLFRPMFDYWRFEHNEFVHFVQPFGRDMSVPRMGSTVSKQIPDILEFILTCGGGSLVIKREDQTIATIEHIPFLGLRMKAIEKMLSETRVTTR